jgi:hypothetical protein
MLEDADAVFTGGKIKQIEYRPGETPDPEDLQPALRIKMNGLIEQPHHKRRWQQMQTVRTGDAAAASKVKDDLRVTIRHDLEIRCLFAEIPPVIPKAPDGVPQRFRRLKFLVQ